MRRDAILRSMAFKGFAATWVALSRRPLAQSYGCFWTTSSVDVTDLRNEQIENELAPKLQAKAMNGNGNKPFLKCLLIHAHFGATLQSGKIHRNKTPIPASPPTAASCQQLPLVSSWLLSPPWKTVLLSQAKKRRKLHGKRLQRNLVFSEKSSHNLKLWMDCPKHLECLSTYMQLFQNTFGPDSIPFLLLPVVLPCASLAVRGPSKMHQILIWLPLPPATLAESS